MAPGAGTPGTSRGRRAAGRAPPAPARAAAARPGVVVVPDTVLERVQQNVIFGKDIVSAVTADGDIPDDDDPLVVKAGKRITYSHLKGSKYVSSPKFMSYTAPDARIVIRLKDSDLSDDDKMKSHLMSASLYSAENEWYSMLSDFSLHRMLGHDIENGLPIFVFVWPDDMNYSKFAITADQRETADTEFYSFLKMVTAGEALTTVEKGNGSGLESLQLLRFAHIARKTDQQSAITEYLFYVQDIN